MRARGALRGENQDWPGARSQRVRATEADKALAFYFLSQSLKYIPLGVAYAIWSGLGTVGSVLLGLLIWKEVLGPLHLFGIALIVVGVVVLNVAPDASRA